MQINERKLRLVSQKCGHGLCVNFKQSGLCETRAGRTMLVGILSSLLTRKTLAECGLTDFRKLSPCTTILKHTSTESFHACCVPHWLGVCSYTPVVSTARLLADGRVHFVSEEPRKVQVLEQPDLFLVGSSHVGAACVKVPQEHHILHTHTHTQC